VVVEKNGRGRLDAGRGIEQDGDERTGIRDDALL